MTDFLAAIEGDKPKQSGIEAFTEHTADSLRYTLVQAPISGVAQLVDKTLGSKLLPAVQFCEPPQQSEFGSAGWAGDLLGSTAATAIQFGALHRLVGSGAATKLELTSNYGVKAAMPQIGRSVATGMVFGGIFTPVDENGDFLKQRFANAGISGLNFGVMTAGSVYLKANGNSFMRNDIVANAIAGVPGGVLHADLHSLVSKGELSSWRERTESVVNYAAGGAMAGAVNVAREHFFPHTGIKGVRTLDDLKRLADGTIKPGSPEPFAFKDNVYRPPSAEELLASGGKPSVWHERTALAIRQELEGAPLSLEQRKLLVTEHQALAGGLEALNSRPNPKPIVTFYGSARLGKNSAAGQEARWIGGLAAENGFDLMTGGAPTSTPHDGGLMGQSSIGGYKAGTNVIAVTIKLPFEAADAPDGFHTLTIQCRNFPGRMIILRQVDKLDITKPIDAPVPVRDRGFFIVGESGIGTLAEFYDLITQMQTGKIPRRPVYLRGEIADQVEAMTKDQYRRGVISERDLHLFKIIRDPRLMFEDVPKWQMQIAAEETADAVYRKAGLSSPDRASASQKREALSRHFKMPDATEAQLNARLQTEVHLQLQLLNSAHVEIPVAAGLQRGGQPLLRTNVTGLVSEAILPPQPGADK